MNAARQPGATLRSSRRYLAFVEVVLTDLLDDDVQARAALDGSICRGAWQGEIPPRLGLVNVELDVLGDLRWTAPGALSGTATQGNLLFGVVEAAEADGVVTMRVNGGLVLVDVPDPLPDVGQPLRLEQVGLAFFPC